MSEFKDCFNRPVVITICGQELKVSKITISDLVDFQNHFSFLRKKELIQLYKDTDTKIDIKELDQLASDPTYLNAQMQSLQGILHLSKLILQKNNKDKDIDTIINNLSENDIEVLMNSINDSLPEDKEGKPEVNFQEEEKKEEIS